ncbi:50S ribosomal protein L24 [Sulfuriroseicoccus oceanibius]|uniref:Large ribosomal subunit protein uL24 n=1 Tax=Sulfuriroseicoccus oceanibius TaxID=2707525 RepID=A0A6B3L3Z0_9BACT|nr:50S ribosomal protein L24 [Sulfuriroseicoccus oceanibius]QQL45832.1 50S ribosomal protein L24 [Sulfuriroseicoccus oceanibius]
MSKKATIKQGSTVEVIAGNNKGATGTVLQVIASKDRVIVEGVNVRKKHQKPSAANQEGGIVDQEASIHISNVKLVSDK